MCNYSSLSSHVDKTFDIVFERRRRVGRVQEKFWRENLGMRNPCVQGEGLYPFERKRKKERKSMRRVSVSSLRFQPGVRKVRR